MKRILLIFIALFVLSPNTVLADCETDKRMELMRHDLNEQMGTEKPAKYKTDQVYIDILAAEKMNLSQPLPQNKRIGCTTSGEYAYGGEIPTEKLSAGCIKFIAEEGAKTKYIEQLCANETKAAQPVAQQPSSTSAPSSTSPAAETSETPTTTPTNTSETSNTNSDDKDNQDNDTKSEKKAGETCECTNKNDTACTYKNAGALDKIGINKLRCCATTCANGYTLETNDCHCSKATIKKAKSESDCKNAGGKWENKKCIDPDAQAADAADAADDNKSKSSNVSGANDKTSCTKLGGTWVDGACKIAKHSDEEIAALKENAAAMRANEQSAANKALGAAGIAGVGLGAMQMASGMAEQNADAAAEEDMRAYLQTFSCRYGNGLSVRGGETNIELPGQPDLLPLYTEYVNLANDIKVRKAALNMQPGIEAESILDSATTGLYDNVGIGKTGGVFASLSRALMDPNGPDAQRWAEQQDEASKKKNTGLQIAGTALVGTAIANMAINADAPKESSDKITAEYAGNREYVDITAILNQLQIAINAIPSQDPSGTNCPSDATGTYANCKCKDTNKYYASDNTCQPCGKNEKVTSDGRSCECAPDHFRSNGVCTKISGTSAIQTAQNCKLSGNYIHFDSKTGVCSCMDTFIEENNQCVCNLGYIDPQTNQCTTPPATDAGTPPAGTPGGQSYPLPEITFGVNAFHHNSPTLTPKAIEKLHEKLAAALFQDVDRCTISLSGYADKTGTSEYNAKLSQQRAEHIRDEINSKKPANIELKFLIQSFGENDCDCSVEWPKEYTSIRKEDGKAIDNICTGKDSSFVIPDGKSYPPCRRVKMTMICSKTTTGGQ